MTLDYNYFTVFSDGCKMEAAKFDYYCRGNPLIQEGKKVGTWKECNELGFSPINYVKIYLESNLCVQSAVNLEEHRRDAWENGMTRGMFQRSNLFVFGAAFSLVSLVSLRTRNLVKYIHSFVGS